MFGSLHTHTAAQTPMTEDQFIAQQAELADLISDVSASMKIDHELDRLKAFGALLATSDNPAGLIAFVDLDGSLSDLVGSDATVMAVEDLSDKVDETATTHDSEAEHAARKAARKEKIKKGLKIAAGLAAGAAALYGAKKLHASRAVNESVMTHKVGMAVNKARAPREELSVMEGALKHKDLKTAGRKVPKASPNVDRDYDAATKSVYRELEHGPAEADALHAKVKEHLTKLKDAGHDAAELEKLHKRADNLHSTHRLKTLKAAKKLADVNYTAAKNLPDNS